MPKKSDFIYIFVNKLDLSTGTAEFSLSFEKNNTSNGSDTLNYFKNQQWYVASFKANKKIENNITELENYIYELNQHFILCAKVAKID